MAYDYLLWIVATVVVALGLLAVVFVQREKFKSPDQLQALGTALVVLGIVFGEDRAIGYSLMGGGVLLSVVSMEVRRRRAKSQAAKNP